MRHAAGLVVSLGLLAACGADDAPPATCSLDDAGDAGTVPALAAQRCNVPGSMGMRKWWRLSATLPGSDDVVQLELYEQAGAFAGGTVTPGTYAIEPDPGTCGVCVRAAGAVGTADALEYRALGGSVTIEAIGAGGATITATIMDATFEDVGGGTCVAALGRIQITGTVTDLGGGGGGGGGGTSSCPTTVGG